MPDGRLMKTGGLRKLAEPKGMTLDQVDTLVEQGGTLKGNREALACQTVNDRLTVADSASRVTPRLNNGRGGGCVSYGYVGRGWIERSHHDERVGGRASDDMVPIDDPPLIR